MRKIIILIALLLPLFSWGQSTILKNVHIIDVVGEQIIQNRSIEIKSGLIVNIHNSTYSGLPQDTVIDLSGKFIIPGLIDSHTHIEHSAYWDIKFQYNPPRENLLALLKHALLGGITTIREMACDVRVIGELSRASKLNLIPAPNIYYPSVFAGPKFFADPRAAAGALGEIPGETSWFRAVDDEMDVVGAVAEAKGNGSYALKLYALLTPDQIKSVIQEARRQDMRVWGHAYMQLAKPSEIISSGIDDVSHAPLLLYELSAKPDYSKFKSEVSELTELFNLMRTRDVSLDPTIFVYEHIPGAGNRVEAAKLITRSAKEAGVRILAGTDSISAYKELPYPFIHDEIAFYVNECGFTPMEALQAATLNPAITMHLENKIGAIEIGKKANLVVLEKNPIEDISNTKSVLMTLKDGIIYYRKDL